MQEQCHELSEWRQNNPDTHRPSYVKKPCVPSRPTKSKQISMLVPQQVPAEMQKYNRSAHVDNTNTADKATADDEQHLMSWCRPLLPSILQHNLNRQDQLDHNWPTAVHHHLTGKPPSNS